MTTICLIRHGETDWNVEKRLQGREDIPLNQSGKDSAQACGNYLSQQSWDVLITSPLIRAKETAEIIAKSLGSIAIDEIAGFVERDYGAASGLLPDDRKSRFPEGVFPHQEDWSMLRDRVMLALTNVAEVYKNQKVLIVSHGAAINSILATVSNGSIGSGKTNLKNCCLNGLNYEHSKWRIDYYNQTVFDLSAKA